MEEKRVITVNKYEYSLLINALIEYRNKLITEGKSTDLSNELFEKVANAPMKKHFLSKREKISER